MSMTTALKKEIQKMARESVREALREEIPFIELVLSPSTRLPKKHGEGSCSFEVF